MGILDGPFRGSDAVNDGLLTRHQLACVYSRVYRDVYVRKGIVLDARAMAIAASVCASGGGSASGGTTVIAGISAAAFHGAKWIGADEVPTLIAANRSRGSDRLKIHFDALDVEDCQVIDGCRVTTPVRTMFDLGRWIPYPRSIEVMDALMAATGVDVGSVRDYAAGRSGVRGIRGLASALDLVDGGAESPQETRTRLLLVCAGLPRPSTQIRVRDAYGRVFARLDIGWEQWKVGVEYDGIQHWTSERQRTRDIERFDELEQVEWSIVRVNSEQLRLRPHDVVARVRAKLRAAGAPV